MFYLKSKFPSPYGVSFILIKQNKIIKGIHKYSFRLLTEYHSFLFSINVIFKSSYMFPSPYGVSFILIDNDNDYHVHCYQFPSPYGVSFILIITRRVINMLTMRFRLLTEYHSFLFQRLGCYNQYSKKVSVSLRSIIHSYFHTSSLLFLIIPLFPSPYGVSFILMINLQYMI